MRVHKANHDIQMVVDQYACAQYVVGYLTKNESGMSKLLKAVNEKAKDMSNMDLLNQLSAVIDKHREVSIQEAAYRLLSLVKHLSTIHPHFRDGLLRADLENLDENESIFHASPHQYYENLSMECRDGIIYKDYELKEGYWENLSLSEFWSLYDIVYGPKRGTKKGI